jgi:hypothetical protein
MIESRERHVFLAEEQMDAGTGGDRPDAGEREAR